MNSEGRSTKEIREAIIRGDWKFIELSIR